MRVLDLYCGEGGAGMGYHQAGYEVFGVDIADTGRYPFPIAKMDAVAAMVELNMGFEVTFKRPWQTETLALSDFDFIHASPPCQRYSIATIGLRDKQYPDLIPVTRRLLIKSGKPWVIENVEGAPLFGPTMLCGTMFALTTVDHDGTALEMWRHRLFEANWKLSAPMGCRHGHFAARVAGAYGGGGRKSGQRRGYVPSLKVVEKIMGIDWMPTRRGLFEAIPPAYTKWIGEAYAQLERAPQGPDMADRHVGSDPVGAGDRGDSP